MDVSAVEESGLMDADDISIEIMFNTDSGVSNYDSDEDFDSDSEIINA